MLLERLMRRAGHEDGFAMVAAVTLTSVMLVFTMGMLATGIHLHEATVKDEHWNRALQVAEAGVEYALHVTEAGGSYPASVNVNGGVADLTVATGSDGTLTVYSTGWSPDKTSADARKRRIKATFGAEDSFDFAIYSDNSIVVNNTGDIHGDVRAKQSVLFENNMVVYGDLVAETGTVRLKNSAQVRPENGSGGDVYSGGYDSSGLWGIKLDQLARIYGNATAAVENTCATMSGSTDRYNIDLDNNAAISGTATAWGSISGGTVGTRNASTCAERLAPRAMPEFTWDPSLYTGEVEYTSRATYESWATANSSALSGVQRVWDPSCESDPSGSANVISFGSNVTVSDDWVLVTNCRVNFVNQLTISAPSDSIVNIIVLNESTDPVALDIKNTMDVTNGAAVLLYSTGLVENKNSMSSNGAIYGEHVNVKNDLGLTYDSRVERTLGFGSVKYDRMLWLECRPSQTGTAC